MEYRIERERFDAEIEDSQTPLEELQRELESRRRRRDLLEEQYCSRREHQEREQ